MNRIRELRMEKGLKQAWLASKLHLTQTAVSNYELGTRDPSVETILELCEIFNCSADYLLGRTTERNTSIDDQDAAMLKAYRSAPYSVQTAITVLLSPYIQNAADASGKTGSRAV